MTPVDKLGVLMPRTAVLGTIAVGLGLWIIARRWSSRKQDPLQSTLDIARRTQGPTNKQRALRLDQAAPIRECAYPFVSQQSHVLRNGFVGCAQIS